MYITSEVLSCLCPSFSLCPPRQRIALFNLEVSATLSINFRHRIFALASAAHDSSVLTLCLVFPSRTTKAVSTRRGQFARFSKEKTKPDVVRRSHPRCCCLGIGGNSKVHRRPFRSWSSRTPAKAMASGDSAAPTGAVRQACSQNCISGRLDELGGVQLGLQRI